MNQLEFVRGPKPYEALNAARSVRARAKAAFIVRLNNPPRACLQSSCDVIIPHTNRHGKTHSYCPDHQSIARFYARIKHKYGLSREQYDVLDLTRCQICDAIPNSKRNAYRKTLCIDHDHDTGIFRGMLCHRCNTGLGMLGDKPMYLTKLLSYLTALN